MALYDVITYRPEHLFGAKLILACLYLIGASVVLFTCILLCIGSLHLVGFSATGVVNLETVQKLVYSVVAGMAIVTIQHAVSWRWQNIVVPLGLGVMATMSIVQFGSSKYWLLNPWTYPLVATNGAGLSMQSDALLYSIIVTAILALISMFWLSKKEIRC